MRRPMFPEITHAELIRRLQLEIEASPSEAAVARKYGVSPQLFSMILSGRRNISTKMLKAMKLRRVTLVVHRYVTLARDHTPGGTRKVNVRKFTKDLSERIDLT